MPGTWEPNCVIKQFTPCRDLSGDSCLRRQVSMTTLTCVHQSGKKCTPTDYTGWHEAKPISKWWHLCIFVKYIYITLYNCVCWMFIYSLLHHASACATFLTKNSQEGLRWNREHAGFHTGLWQSDRGFCDVWCQENVANLGERFIQSVASCEQSPSKHESCLIAFLSLNWGQLQEKFTVCDK